MALAEQSATHENQMSLVSEPLKHPSVMSAPVAPTDEPVTGTPVVIAIGDAHSSFTGCACAVWTAAAHATRIASAHRPNVRFPNLGIQQQPSGSLYTLSIAFSFKEVT